MMASQEDLKNFCLLGRPFVTFRYFEKNSVTYELDYTQRLFVTFEYQDACILSNIIFFVTSLAIVLGVVTFILSGDPQFNVSPASCDKPVCHYDASLCPGQTICEPQPPAFFDTMDDICAIIFTIDYMIRVLTCWSVPRELAGVGKKALVSTNNDNNNNKDRSSRHSIIFWQVFWYMVKIPTLIDLCAFLPFYIELGLPGSNGGSSSFVRVLRLVRLLRLLKIGKLLSVLGTSLADSVHGLIFTVFLMSLTIIFFASIMFIAEQGTFKVTPEYPYGAYMRPTKRGDSEEKSSFESVSASIYYMIITQTTTGYGDLYPTTIGGRAVACIMACLGIVLLALPIAIVGTHFNMKYRMFMAKLLEEKEEEEEAAAAAAAAAKEERKQQRERKKQQLSTGSGRRGSILSSLSRSFSLLSFHRPHGIEASGDTFPCCDSDEIPLPPLPAINFTNDSVDDVGRYEERLYSSISRSRGAVEVVYLQCPSWSSFDAGERLEEEDGCSISMTETTTAAGPAAGGDGSPTSTPHQPPRARMSSAASSSSLTNSVREEEDTNKDNSNRNTPEWPASSARRRGTIKLMAATFSNKLRGVGGSILNLAGLIRSLSVDEGDDDSDSREEVCDTPFPLLRFETLLEKALHKCREALEQNKQREEIDKSKKLRAQLTTKHRRKIAVRKMASTPRVAPRCYVYEQDDIKREYQLTLLGRVFMTLEDSNSSLLGRVISIAMMAVICLSVACYIMSTIAPTFVGQPDTCTQPVCYNDPILCPYKTVCEPQSLPIFDLIDESTVILFTIEFVARLLLCWSVPRRIAGLLPETWDDDEAMVASEEHRLPLSDPEPYSWYYQLFRYLTTINSIIDIVAIVPYYIGLGLGGSGVSLSFARVLRLARVMRLLKLMKNNEYITVLAKTLTHAFPTLLNTFVLALLMVIFLGSIEFIVEQGTFQVTADYPQGAYLRPDLLGGDVMEVSPFRSISASIYWSIITTTFVGYGDLYPTSIAGRVIACVAALCGVLVIAIPVGVIGGDFRIEYAKMVKAREKRFSKDVTRYLGDELAAVGLPAEEEEVIDPYEAMKSFVKSYKKMRKKAAVAVNNSETLRI